MAPTTVDELAGEAGEERTSEHPAASTATVAPAIAQAACTRTDTQEIYKAYQVDSNDGPALQAPIATAMTPSRVEPLIFPG